MMFSKQQDEETGTFSCWYNHIGIPIENTSMCNIRKNKLTIIFFVSTTQTIYYFSRKYFDFKN